MSENEKKEVVFAVYGTLKQGYGNHGYIKGAKYLGEYKTPARYKLFNGGFPVVERGGTTSVQCELFKTDDERIIKNVFGLEGCVSQEQGHKDNWYDIDYLETPEGIAVIFVMDEGKSERTDLLEDGIWSGGRMKRSV